MPSVYTCGLIIEAVSSGSLPRWPESPITWHTDGGVGTVSAGDFQAIIQPHCTHKITDICGAQFAYSPNAKTANILIRAARNGEGGMGRPSGTLADTLLVPAGLRRNADFQSLMRCDGAEHWTSLEDLAAALAQGKVPITWVVAHELGHALGLGHSPDTEDLMGAMLGPQVTGFGPWAIDQFVRRYGPVVVAAPAPPTQPMPGDPVHWEVRANGVTMTFVGDEPQVFRNAKRQSLEDSRFA